MRRVSLLVLILASAGCLRIAGDEGEPDPAPEGPPWWETALPFGDGHDHAVASHHANRSTPNIQVLGWDPLLTQTYGASAGSYYCGDVAARDDRKLVAVHSFFSDVAIVIADVTDPGAPVVVGELRLPRTQVWDAELSSDGRFAVLATSPLDSGADSLWVAGNGPSGAWLPRAAGNDASPRLPPAPVMWRGCGAERGPVEDALAELPLAPGLVLVDLRDLAEPKVADFVPQPVMGGHSIHASRVDGTNYVLAATVNVDAQSSYFSVFTVLETDPARLVPHGSVPHAFDREAGAVGESAGHNDGYVQRHPVTGDTLLYAVAWNQGLGILDVAQPGAFEMVGRWNDFTGEYHTGAWHTVFPLPDLWDGRHITVVGQEIYSSPGVRPTGQVVLLDTTDPTLPVPVARWTLPYEPEWQRALWSTHYLTVVNQTLWVAMNHGGVWAADASPAQWPELPSLGVFLPTHASPAPPPPGRLLIGSVDFLDLAPFVGDVVDIGGGAVAAFDTTSGVYTLRLDRDVPVPPAPPWTEDAWIAP